MKNDNKIEYLLMHMEKKVASIDTSGTCKIFNKKFLPYNIYLEEGSDIDTRINNLSNFYHWCSSRILTLDRKYAKIILNFLSQSQATTDKERANISLTYHALTITDVYWVKIKGEKIKFSDINLYTNSLSASFVDVSLRGKNLTLQNRELVKKEDIASNISTLGVAPKAWIRKNKKTYLLKDGASKEVRAELLASRIAREFSVNQIKYIEDEYDNKKVSKSILWTSLDRSIVSSEYVKIYAMNHDIDFYEMVLKIDAYNFYMMNIIDYIVGNTDRHMGNWGFEVNNKTNKLVRLHPLMDFNKAFTAYNTIEGTNCLTTKELMSQKDAAIIAVKALGLKQIKKIGEANFDSKSQYKMYAKRVNILNEAMSW